VSCADLIGKGQVKGKVGGANVAEITPDSVKLSDGNMIEADDIILV
jgi:hypothetical protein